MEPAIQAKGLSKAYKGALAIANVDISVKRGEVFGLLGANGAGKSTTIECLVGTRTGDKGTVSILGMNPRKQRREIFKRVGVQFQDAAYQDKITVKELCEETSCLYENSLPYAGLLKEFGLEEKQKSPVNALSGGQRQRLFVVLALIPDPQVVFLDELTTGLDARARRDVWNRLIELKQKGMTMILTSHFMDEVEALCDRVGILKKGAMVFCGTADEMKEAASCERLEDAYLWFTDEEEMK